MKKTVKKILATVLALVLLLSAVPMNTVFAEEIVSSLAAEKTLSFAALSDIHYFPYSLTGDYCDAFIRSSEGALAREPYQSEGLLDSALAAVGEHARTKGLKYLLIPGDLTSNGEKQAHIDLAARLEKFEADTGVQVIAINGNHDVNYYHGETFESGERESTSICTPDEFLEIYKNLGYDLAYHHYAPKSGTANMLSYSVRANGYRFIVLDTAKYSAEVTKKGDDKGETAGGLTQDCVDWLLAEIADAKACGEVPVSVNHHNFVPHYTAEYTIIRGFCVEGWEELSEQLADAGLRYSFTGHIHDNDIAQCVSDNGETLTEICCDSLTAFPNYFREMEATTTASGKITMDVKSFDVDCVKPVTVNGYTYPTPFRKESLKLSFIGDDGLSGVLKAFIVDLLDEYAAKFVAQGLTETLKGFGLDLEETLKGFIGNGLVVGGKEILSVKNLMLFIEDLFGQISDLYLTDPKATADWLCSEIDKLLAVQVSELPNTEFIDSYGFGDPNKPGTFEDLLECLILYKYEGDKYLEDDAFMMDALYQLENGDTVFKIFDVLYEFAVTRLVQEKLLGSLELRVESLFPEGTLANATFNVIGTFFRLLLKGDGSYLNIANNVVLLLSKLGIFEYTSLVNILEHYMDEYLTDTQLQGVGQSLANIVREFAADYSIKPDSNAVLVYDGPIAVEATRENYRLPTGVAVTLGENQQARNINWLTKTSVKGNDIEIVEDGSDFNGVNSAPDGVKVTATSERVTRQFPGVDLGVLGIMNYEFPMNRHIVKVTGLQPGKTYYYRVGDASRNWWSETGSFRLADGGKDTTFVHIGDPQSQSAQQYETFSTLIEKAYEMYDSDFIIDTGDNVDHGNNFRQWQWFLNGASDTLMNTALMSASGNHEGKGEFAIADNFTYSNVPEQDEESGIYYSFDYNNVHVAILNSNDLDKDESLSDAQIDWLKKDMQESDADWKFVALHKAPYSNGSHYDDKDVCEIRDELCTLMPQLGIDIVFQGHDHVYLRTDAMIDNEVEAVTTSTATFNGKEYTVKESPVGSVYVISGCSGVKVYKQKDASLTDEYFPRAEAIEDVSLSVFSGVRIVDNILYFDAYTVDVANGDTQNIDSFAIRKDLSVKKGTGVPDGNSFKEIFDSIVAFITPILLKLVEISAKLLKIEFFGLI